MRRGTCENGDGMAMRSEPVPDDWEMPAEVTLACDPYRPDGQLSFTKKVHGREGPAVVSTYPSDAKRFKGLPGARDFAAGRRCR